MIKNIRDLSWIVSFSLSAINFQRDRSDGPYSHDFVQRAFYEHPDETISFTYIYHQGIMSQLMGMFRGDFSAVWALGGWMVKKSWGYVVIPSAVTYCVTGYCVYRVYTIIRYIDSFFPSPRENQKKETDEKLIDDIDHLLYRNIKRSRNRSKSVVAERQKLYHMLQQYQNISQTLESLGVRKLFWYNVAYEKRIKDLLRVLKDSCALPN